MAQLHKRGRLAAADLYLLTYAQHMAETARCVAAKHVFEAYVKQERQRLEASGLARTSVGDAPRLGAQPTAALAFGN